MRLIPWYFASKYDTLKECEDVHEEVRYYLRRFTLPTILAGVVCTVCMILSDYIDIDGWYEITALVCLFCGVVFGIGLAISEMNKAINCRKKEIVDEMWSEGHPATGQFKED